MAEVLARLRHHRRVNHRHHLLDVVQQQPVEQHFVVVLQGTQADVAAQIGIVGAIGLIGPSHLLIQSFHLRGQQPVQAESASLFVGKRRTFVQGGDA